MSEQQVSIFNVGQHADAINEQMYRQRGESPLFDIRVKNVGDTTSFIIRPVPYIKDVIHKSKVLKYFYAIPDGQNYVIYDSRTTFNKPEINHWEFCPISDIWAKLKNSVDPNVQNMAMQLRRQVGIYIYVMVVNCPDEPKYNGKIMPMKIPIEMETAMFNMANPSEAQKKLGKTGIQPFDIINGCNLECTITGHKPRPTDPVMRDWKVSVEKPSELQLPLGPNGAMVNVSTLPQADVEKYFLDQQTIDLQEMYGYKAPNADANIKAYNWLMSLNIIHVPGIREAIIQNFQTVVNAATAGSQPAAAQVSIPDPMAVQNQGSQAPQATENANAGNQEPKPVATTPMPATTPAPVTVTTPAPQTVENAGSQAPQATENAGQQPGQVVIPD